MLDLIHSWSWFEPVFIITYIGLWITIDIYLTRRKRRKENSPERGKRQDYQWYCR